MKKVRQSYAGLILAAVLAMALSVFCPMAVWAEDPIVIPPGGIIEVDVNCLYPGYIKGAVSTGNTGKNTSVIKRSEVWADGIDPDGKPLASNFALSMTPGDYQMTACIPDDVAKADGKQAYYVGAKVYYTDEGYFLFKGQKIDVADNTTQTVNFQLKPGYIAGTLETTCELESGWIRAKVGNNMNTDAQFFDTVVGIKVVDPHKAVFYFPVTPYGNVVKVWGSYKTKGGWTYKLEEKIISVAEGQEVDPGWEIKQCDGPPCSGTITGQISLNGFENGLTGLGEINKLVKHKISLTGATEREAEISANGTYKLEGLQGGEHYLAVTTYLNGMRYFDDWVIMPKGDAYKNVGKVTVPECGTVTRDITANATFLNGKFTFKKGATVVEFLNNQTPDNPMPTVSGGEIAAAGVINKDVNILTKGIGKDRNGWSQDSIDVGSGKYDMILTEGEWNPSYSLIRFRHAKEMPICGNKHYINSQMLVDDYKNRSSLFGNQISLPTKDGKNVIDNNNIEFETGAVTVKFNIYDGGTFSSPYVFAENKIYSADKKLERVVQLSGWGTPATDYASTGEVTIIGLPGTYSLAANAVINGTRTTFGRNEIIIIAGACQEFEIGAPTLTLDVTNTCNSEVTVNGKATDKMSPIQSVKINGEIIAFTATGNADNEVTFNITLPLQAGENKIETEVTNNAGKTVSDSRTVNSYSAGTFVVGDEGLVNIDWLYDGGKYQGQFGIFSLDGMGQFTPGSPEFITEVTNRVLSNTEKGYLVFSDLEEGARFSGILGNEIKDWNAGDYKGVKSFAMKPGSCFATVLIPNSTFASVAQNPATTDANKRPLFSLVSANPAYGMSMGQMADVNGMGKAYSYEDKDAATSDRDFNDLIVMITGATADLPSIDDLKSQRREKRDYGDWRDSDFGRLIMAHVESAAPINPITVTLKGSATLLVYDAQGKVIGKSGGTLVGADFAMTADSQTVTLPDGSYRIVIQGVKAETCLLSVKDSQGNLKEIQVDTALHQVFGTTTALETPTASAGYDFNGDGITDNTDVEMLVKHWNSCRGQQKYDAFFDVNDDGCITVADIMTVLNAKTVK